MNYFVPSTSSTSKISDKIWLVLWVLFGLSLFVSKSGISIFGTILLLWSFFKFDWKNELQQNPWIAAILGIFPAAIIISLFSIGGPEAAINVMRGWAWPLYVIPFAVLIQDKKLLKIFGWSLALGLVASCVKAFYSLATELNWTLGPNVRVTGFWDTGRWGYVLACSAGALFALVGHKPTWSKAGRLEKMVLTALLAITLLFLVLANTRGPWLAAGAGILLLGISGCRYLKLLPGVLLFVGISFSLVPGVRERLQSSFSAKTENGVVTSKDASNAGRLHMWQVNLQLAKEHPFLGTGFETAEKPLREFIEKQGPEFKEKYIDPEFSFSDQHNSYLQTYVQLGIFFFVFLWGMVAILMLGALKGFFANKDVLVKIAFALVATQLFIFIFYSSVSSYEGLWFYPMLFVLSTAVVQHKVKVIGKGT